MISINTGQTNIVLGFFIFLFSASSVKALEHEITENINVSGGDNRVVISPFQVSALESRSPKDIEYTMYEIDYGELKRQIKIYQQIYVTGQLLHGYLMIKMKPKFVD